MPFALDVADALPTLGDAAARESALRAFEAAGLPTTRDEVWRYAPLERLDLDRVRPAVSAGVVPPSRLADAIASGSCAVVHTVDGFVVEQSTVPDGVRVTVAPPGATPLEGSSQERYAADAFALVNAALAPGALEIRIERDVVLEAPLVVVHHVSPGLAVAPRTHIVLERGAAATVVELLVGGAGSVVVPVGEYRLEANSSLRLVAYQRLAMDAWHVARTTAVIDRDARMSHSVLGLGAVYDRSRNDAELIATGARNELRTTYLGRADQVHDLRTRQFHRAARTTSVLLSKGAVDDASRSIYTGLIEIEHGARKTDARQTNHNLLLSPHAHADSVPNLDIRENDVVCAHASTVGPLDELQLWYLQSRGVSRDDAQRLMIQGFFAEMLDDLPSGVATSMEEDVAALLGGVEVSA